MFTNTKTIFVLVFFIFLLLNVAIHAQNLNDSTTKVIDKDIAMLTAMRYLKSNKMTGLHLSLAEKEMTLVNIVDTTTPFLSDSINGKLGYIIPFSNSELDVQIKGYREEIKPAFKDITVSINAKTGRLYKVVIENTNLKDEERARKPSKGYAEYQIHGSGNKYTGFPTEEPAISLLKALEACPIKLNSAKEIVAIYVLHSHLWEHDTPYRWIDRPVWNIHFYGIPPLLPPRQNPDIPLEQRNHWNCIVDAQTGNLIRESNTPQPDRRD